VHFVPHCSPVAHQTVKRRSDHLLTRWYVCRCQPLTEEGSALLEKAAGRGLHSPTLQLNLSALYGIAGARKGCVARVKGVLGIC